ncbi:hypothetical protein BCR43DRAFT_133656 [Syncephalastrum racemosum]|uniref:Uncharacterized protein n=1 Tax=Syncephalastrum racemosum TaxID=13706 RepID=A0A1X2HLG7_SYNRA|nr:hypothetical protein BCR43DRAFT_133656 [Syncephalastrum racemosum]
MEQLTASIQGDYDEFQHSSSPWQLMYVPGREPPPLSFIGGDFCTANNNIDFFSETTAVGSSCDAFSFLDIPNFLAEDLLPGQTASCPVGLLANFEQNAVAMLPSSALVACEQQPRKAAKLKRKSSNARMGYCQHPKHVAYRQEQPKYIYTASSESRVQCTQGGSAQDKTVVRLSAPRRGRPPKGTRAIDLQTINMTKTGCPSVSGGSDCPPSIAFPWKMTVRPLPKRLEAVVGCEQIRVCLTCLKRSDQDPEYLSHPKYVRPVQKPATISRKYSNT